MRVADTMTSIEGNRDTLLVAAAILVLPRNARELLQQTRDLFALLAHRAPAG
jgi:hypothetical protein